MEGITRIKQSNNNEFLYSIRTNLQNRNWAYKCLSIFDTEKSMKNFDTPVMVWLRVVFHGDLFKCFLRVCKTNLKIQKTIRNMVWLGIYWLYYSFTPHFFQPPVKCIPITPFHPSPNQPLYFMSWLPRSRFVVFFCIIFVLGYA